jgi:hypothetical protein
MPVVAGEVRIIKVQVRMERIAPDGVFHCDVNPLHEQAEWMTITGQRVRIAMCEQCKREFEQAVVE